MKSALFVWIICAIAIFEGCTKSPTSLVGYSCTCNWLYHGGRDTYTVYNFTGISKDSAVSECATKNAAYQASYGVGAADCVFNY